MYSGENVRMKIANEMLMLQPQWLWLVMRFTTVIDGVVVTSSFLISTEVGITVTLSIIFHEVPKGLGDLSILIRNGFNA